MKQEKLSMLPHGTGDYVLSVGGRSFHNLYSGDYLWIPEWRSILFVTHREGSIYKLHVYSLETKRDSEFETDQSFGANMGRAKTDNLTCFVEKVNGDIAVLVERGYKSPDFRYELNRMGKLHRLSTKSPNQP